MKCFDLIFVGTQVVMIILYGCFTQYADELHPASQSAILGVSTEIADVLGEGGVEELNFLVQRDKVQRYYIFY